MRFLILPAAALVCCISTGCASDVSHAREAARTFLTAMSQSDATGAQAIVTRAARPNVITLLQKHSPTNTSFTFTLGDPVVKEDSAEVPMTLASRDSKPTVGKVLLRREEKEWRVWGLQFQTENGTKNGPEVTLDLEHPERMVGELLGAAVGELSKSLENLGKSSEKAGRQLGEALGGFLKGFSEGVQKSAPSTSPKPSEEKSEGSDVLAPPVVK